MAGRIDLVHGPVEGVVHLNSAVTLRTSHDQTYGVAMTLAEHDGPGDWILAVLRSQSTSSMFAGPDLALVTSDAFNDQSPIGDARRVDAADGWGLQLVEDAIDLDGDGVLDLPLHHYEQDVDPTTVTWLGAEAAFLSGPFDGYRWVEDADVVVLGPSGCQAGQSSGLDADTDLDADGVQELVVACTFGPWPTGASGGAVVVVEPPQTGTTDLAEGWPGPAHRAGPRASHEHASTARGSPSASGLVAVHAVAPPHHLCDPPAAFPAVARPA